MSPNFKNILSAALLIAALILGWQASELYASISVMQGEITKYNEANVKLSSTKERLDSFIAFTEKNPETVDKFSIILPNKEDKASFMSAMESMAAANGVLIKKIGFSESKGGDQGTQVDPVTGELIGGVSDKFKYHVVDISFSATYSTLKNFLGTIEKSLKIADVTRVEFDSASGGEGSGGGEEKSESNASSVYDFAVGLKTYWQKDADEAKLAAFLNESDFSSFAFTEQKQFTDLVSPADYNIIIDKANELGNSAPF